MINLFGEDKLRAVAYYRFSAEDKQENSIENQREAVEKLVQDFDISIIEAFEDEGITGMVTHRPALQKMLNKYIYSDNAPKINYILVYDSSRLSRLKPLIALKMIAECEEKGIRLGTVERGIPQGEMTVVDTFILVLDFARSRETVELLSIKVHAGSVRIAQQGYSAGGSAPYGYIRILLDEQRNRKQVLEPGVHKEVSNQRVAFEPASTGEAEVVKRIFHEFVDLNSFPDEIANHLNKDKIPTAKDRQWNTSGIIRILNNETYTGTRIYNKTSAKLKEKKHPNPPEDWIKCPDAHKALVDIETFHKAQERLYWLRPRIYNRSLRYINWARQYTNSFVAEAIKDEYTEDQQDSILSRLPVVFGATYRLDKKKHQCFYLDESLRKYPYLLACGVDVNGKDDNSLDRVYCVPNEALPKTRYLVLTSKDRDYRLKTDQIQEKVQDLAREVIIQLQT